MPEAVIHVSIVSIDTSVAQLSLTLDPSSHTPESFACPSIGAPGVAAKKRRKGQHAGNWRVNSFGADENGETEIDENGITVKLGGNKSHLESFAAKHNTDSEESSAPRLAKDSPSTSLDRKRLDVSNAFEAELRRRVYDASPSERKARSDAARELVDKMIQERLGEARIA